MKDEAKVVHEITRYSIDIEKKGGGDPDEKSVRNALALLFTQLGSRFMHDDIDEYFPIIFPLELKLETETLRWDFQIVAKLQNAVAIDDFLKMRPGGK